MPSLRVKWESLTPVLPPQGLERKDQERSAQTSKLWHKTFGPVSDFMASDSLSCSMESSTMVSGLNIKPLGIMHHGTRLLSISGLSSDLYLPIIVTNPRSTNSGTLKSRRMWRMINTAESHLFGCKV